MTGCLRKPHCIPLAHEKLAIVTIRIFCMARETISILIVTVCVTMLIPHRACVAYVWLVILPSTTYQLSDHAEH